MHIILFVTLLYNIIHKESCYVKGDAMRKLMVVLIPCFALFPLSCTTNTLNTDQKVGARLAAYQETIQKLTQEKEAWTSERALLTGKIGKLQEEIDHLKERLLPNVTTPVPPEETSPETSPEPSRRNSPNIRGTVLSIEGASVMISTGKTEGVQPGMKFFVYRNEKCIGHIRVKTVYKDSAVGSITEQNQHASIKEHDGVKWFSENTGPGNRKISIAHH
jgi:hypothetical protein